MGWNRDDYLAAALILVIFGIALITALYLLGMAPGSHPQGWFLK